MVVARVAEERNKPHLLMNAFVAVLLIFICALPSFGIGTTEVHWIIRAIVAGAAGIYLSFASLIFVDWSLRERARKKEQKHQGVIEASQAKRDAVSASTEPVVVNAYED